MDLQIRSCRDIEISPRAELVRKYIDDGNTIDRIAEFLNSTFKDDFFEVTAVKFSKMDGVYLISSHLLFFSHRLKICEVGVQF